MRYLLLWLFLLTLPAQAGGPVLVLDGAFGARDLTPYLEYLEDPGRALRVPDVAAADAAGRFVAYKGRGNVNFGYSSSAYWLKLKLDNRLARDWLLEVAYPPLDRVDLYYRDLAGGLAHLRSGDLLPFAERPYPDRNLVFPLQLPTGTSTLYLRIESEGSLTVPATLWQPEAFARAAPGDYAVLALYFGALLALGCYNLLLFFSIRDGVYLQYVLFAFGMAIGLGSMNGFAQAYIWPGWPTWANVAYPFGFAIAGVFGALFTRSFLDLRRTAPFADKALAAIMALFLLAMIALLVSYRGATMLVSLAALLVSVASLSAGLLAWRSGHPAARYFLLAWTVLLIGAGMMGMRNFGWLPTNPFTVYSMQVGSVLDLLLLSFALADRINVMRGEKEAAQAESLVAKQDLLETARRTEEELEQRVESRTRELELANSSLRENERTLSQLARQDALTGLGNRIALEEEMARAIGRSGRLGTGVAVMLIDLDSFKPINDAHGHGVGDEVLRQVALRLKKSTRRNDTLARLGGDEFVVVLEGRNVVTDAYGVAEKILAGLDAEIAVQGHGLRIGASIGIALLSGRESPDDLVRRADVAMYRAKREGGNRFALEES